MMDLKGILEPMKVRKLVSGNGVLIEFRQISGTKLFNTLEVSFLKCQFYDWNLAQGTLGYFEDERLIGFPDYNRKSPYGIGAIPISKLPLNSLIDGARQIEGLIENLAYLYIVDGYWGPYRDPRVQFMALLRSSIPAPQLLTDRKTELHHLDPFIDLHENIKVMNGLLYRDGEEVTSVSDLVK